MNHRAQVRAMQDHVLRDSLAGSSMSALTVAVTALLAAHLFAGPETRVVSPPDFYDPPPRDDKDYVPKVPSGGGIEVPPDPEFVPVDQEAADSVLVPEPLVVGPGPGAQSTIGIEPPSVGSGGTGTGEPPVAVIPPPGTYVWRDEDPRAVVKVEPEYPGLAREAGIEGRVRVRMFVGTDGKVHRAEIVGPASVFDAEALEAVRQWVFTPAKAGDHPVGVWIDLPIVFRLD